MLRNCKQRLIAPLALLCVALALSCKPAVTVDTDTRTTAQKALDEGLTLDMITFPGGGSLTAVTSSFMVPLHSKDAAFDFAWSSSSTFVKKIDALTGQVFINIPDPIPADTSATLTVTATLAKARSAHARAAAVSTDTGATKDFAITIAKPVPNRPWSMRYSQA